MRKPLPDIFFSQNGMRQAEKEKKKFYFRIPFKPDQGKKIPKKIAKNLEKLKKPLSDINFSQNGFRQAEKEKKKNYYRIPFILDPGMKIPKKIAKKFKKLKTSFRHYFQPKRDEMGQERGREILLPNSVPTQPELENSTKKKQKNSKN